MVYSFILYYPRLTMPAMTAIRISRTFPLLLAALLASCCFADSHATKPRDHAGVWDVFEGHGFQVRSRASDPKVCAGVGGTSGYVDWGMCDQVFDFHILLITISTGDNHMFYWAFESRHNPASDPVILWLTG